MYGGRRPRKKGLAEAHVLRREFYINVPAPRMRYKPDFLRTKELDTSLTRTLTDETRLGL
jgi:hypothetical protein